MMPDITYKDRKSRGLQRTTFNDGVTKIPGTYNEKGKFKVDIPDFPKYEFFNLTSLSRTQFLQEQFEVMENALKEQFHIANFDEFGVPT